MGIDKSTIQSTAAEELRKRAEDMLRSKVSDVMSTRIEHDTQRLLHELQVHQVELEMQNEELQRLNTELSECSKLNSNIILSLSAHIAVIDSTGCILAVNKSWDDFALQNNLINASVGCNYLDVCRRAAAEDDKDAAVALAGIEAVLNRSQLQFSMEYPCHFQKEQRWFQMTAVPFCDSRSEGVVISHDNITTRKQSEETLKAREKQLQLFIEYAPAALAMFDNKMCYLSASNRWLSDYGLENLNIIGQSHYKIFPEIPEKWIEFHHRGLSGEVLRKDNDCFKRADGTEQWLNWEIRPWYNSRDEVAGIVIFSEDVTLRTQSEIKLQESRSLLNNIIEATPDAIYVKDTQGRYLLFNKAAEDITGKKTIEVLGQDDNYLFSQNEAAVIIKNDQKVIYEGKVTSYEEQVTNAAGKLETYLSTKGPLLDEGGGIIGLFGIARNITERKHAEEALKNSEERYRQLFEMEIDTLILHDQETGQLLEVNPAGLKMYGYTREEILQLKPADLSAILNNIKEFRT